MLLKGACDHVTQKGEARMAQSGITPCAIQEISHNKKIKSA